MSLYARKDSPYWWVKLYVPGRPKREKSTRIHVDAPTDAQRSEQRRQAELFERRAQAAFVLAKQDAPARESIDAAAYFTWYETHVSAHKRGAAREREVLKTLRAAFADAALADVDRARVLEWRTRRRAAVAASTVNREVDVLKHALAAAVPKYLEASPLAGLRRLYAVAREARTLSRVDEARLLAVLGPQDRALVIAALDTLARAGDLLRLEWVHDHGATLTIVAPKTGESYRVPVSTRLRQALDAIRRKGSRFIFPHRRHAETERTRSTGLKTMLRRACVRAGVRYGRGAGITFHSLRHTGATRMVEEGADLRIVQEIGGWKSLRMLTRYAHPSAQRMRDAVNTIGKGVPRPRPARATLPLRGRGRVKSAGKTGRKKSA